MKKEIEYNFKNLEIYIAQNFDLLLQIASVADIQNFIDEFRELGNMTAKRYNEIADDLQERLKNAVN